MTQNVKILEALGTFDVKDDSYWTGDGLPLVEAVQHLAGDLTVTRASITDAAPGFSRSTPSLAPIVEAAATPAPDAEQPPVTTESEPASNGTAESMAAAGATPADVEAAVNPVVTPEADPVVEAELEELKDKLTEPEVSEEEVEVLTQELDELEPGAEVDIENYTLAERTELVRRARLELQGLQDEITELNTAKGKIDSQINDYAVREARIHDRILALQTTTDNTDAIQSYLARQKKNLENKGLQMQTIKESGVKLGEVLKSVSPAPIDQAMRRKNTRGTARPNLARR